VTRQSAPAPFVNDARRCRHVRVTEGRDVLLHEVDEAAVPLEEP
jgi:hypothetical protein